MHALRSAGSAVAMLAALSSSLAAQGTGSLELGAFGQAAYFDRTLRFDQGSGGGGVRLGFFVTPGLELEAEGSFVPTTAAGDLHVDYFPARARLLFNVPAGQHTSLLLGGGYVHNEYRGDLDTGDNGATALAGVRLGIPGFPSIRLNTYLDYMPSPANGAAENWNWGIQVGLSFLTGVDRDRTTPGETEVKLDSAAVAAREDSLAQAAQAEAARRAQADSARALAVRDSLAQVQRDSVRLQEERRQAQAQALRDSLVTAAREDSIRTVALRDSLRTTRDRARLAAFRDSLARVALRDSLRVLVATRASRVTLRGVNFEVNRATLLPISRDILQDVARSLVANPEVTVEVAGHTDNTGPRELNERLSRERAEAVKAFLIENGVAAERMTTQGYAWDQPVASNKTASGRAQNRRTELRRTD